MTAPWSNNSQFALIIITAGGVATGLFVYNGAPALGNPPVFSVVAPGVTADPFGNAVSAVMQAGVPGTGQTTINQSGAVLLSGASGTNVIQLDPVNERVLVYADPPALNSLLASMAALQTTDTFGNRVHAGLTGYSGAGEAVNLPGDRVLYFDSSGNQIAQLIAAHASNLFAPQCLVANLDWAWSGFRSILFGGQPVDWVTTLHPGTAGTAETAQAFSFAAGPAYSQAAGRTTCQYFLNAAPATNQGQSIHIEGSMVVGAGGFVGGQTITNAAPAGYRPNNLQAFLGFDITAAAVVRFGWTGGGTLQTNQVLSGAVAAGDTLYIQPVDLYLNN